MITSVFRLRLPGVPDLNAERHASWLELFFDLAFVLALLGVTARLGTGTTPSAAQLGASIGLFALIQWSWLGQSFYDTRFDPDDTPHRLLVLTATLGAGAITLGVARVPAGLLLPLGYLVVRGCLLLMYLRVLGTDRSARRLVAVYLIGFGTGWLLWAGSLALPVGVRPAVWAAALVIELLTPWLGRRWLRPHPVHGTHLPERLGQFTIILLGATLTSVRDAFPTAHPPIRVIAAAVAAFVVTASIWWIYTTYVSSGLAAPNLGSGQGYAYLHAPGGAAVLFLGWSLGAAVNHIARSTTMPLGSRLLLGGSIVTWMVVGLGLQRFALGYLPRARLLLGLAGVVTTIAVTVTVHHPALLLGFTAAILVAYGIRVSPEIRRVRERQAASGGG